MKSLGTRPTLASMLEDEPVHETKKYGKCQHCTKKKKNIGKYRLNPYDEDVRSLKHMEYICDDCYQMLCDEI